jgi:hypothetical protein
VADDPFLQTSIRGSAQYVSLDVQQMLPHISSSSSRSSSSSSSINKVEAVEAAASPPKHLSLCQLLSWVQQMTWHDTEKLDVSLCAVATHLVLQAHGYQLAGLPEQDVPANSTQGHYCMLTGDAGRSPGFGYSNW